MSDQGDSLSEVKIGNVSGGIQGSIIAGRDVSHVKVMVGGQAASAQDMPTQDQFKQLLWEVLQELAQVKQQQEALAAISPATPLILEGAEQNVEQAAASTKNDKKAHGLSIRARLAEAATLLGSVVDGAKLAEKAVEAGQMIQPVALKLEPLISKLAVAAIWAVKLWPQT